MQPRSLSLLSDETLTQELPAAVARESSATAVTLAYLAEFESRRLFVPAAFASMHEYCVQVLHLSEDSTKKRLQATQVVRQFPAVLAAVADGRLHLSAVVMLATRLTAENVDTLVEACTHKSKSQIEFVLAEFFPRPDVPSSIREVPPLVPQPTLSEAIAESRAPGHANAPIPAARVTPLRRASARRAWSGAGACSAAARLRLLLRLAESEGCLHHPGCAILQARRFTCPDAGPRGSCG